jgi:hypothetical protein
MTIFKKRDDRQGEELYVYQPGKTQQRSGQEVNGIFGHQCMTKLSISRSDTLSSGRIASSAVVVPCVSAGIALRILCCVGAPLHHDIVLTLRRG